MSGFYYTFSYERKINGAQVADYECRCYVALDAFGGWHPEEIHLEGIRDGKYVWVDATPELEQELIDYLLKNHNEEIHNRLDWVAA